MIDSVQTELVKVHVDAHQTFMTTEETKQLSFKNLFLRTNSIDFRQFGLIPIDQTFPGEVCGNILRVYYCSRVDRGILAFLCSVLFKCNLNDQLPNTPSISISND